MKRFLSHSAITLLVFTHPKIGFGDKAHPLYLLESLLLENDLSRTVYIDLQEQEFTQDETEKALDEQMGIFPDIALKQSLEQLKLEWSPSELFYIFKELLSVRFVRCGKTAVIFEMKNKEKFIIIFDQQKVIHKSYQSEVA